VLLRVLQAGEFERVGGTKTITVDARVIAATNRSLAQAVKEGNFREDLYDRLDVFPIEVPPLRERREDIPMLSWTFVKEFSNSMGKPSYEIADEPMSALLQYHWPGNVRELRNVIEQPQINSPWPMRSFVAVLVPPCSTFRLGMQRDFLLTHEDPTNRLGPDRQSSQGE
jgi:formate hydrogenlyase transcriptional activator